MTSHRIMAAALCFMLTIICHAHFLTAVIPVGMTQYLTVDLERSPLSPSRLTPLPAHTPTQTDLILILQLDLAGDTTPPCTFCSVLALPAQTLVLHPACPFLLVCPSRIPLQTLLPHQCSKPIVSPVHRSP